MPASKPKELREYLASEGQSPFHNWIASLRDAKTRARIRVRLDRVGLGNFGDCKSLGGGKQELRIDFGPGYRDYLGQDGNVLVILLCGGDKSTQRRDIKQAREYWEDYQRRKL